MRRMWAWVTNLSTVWQVLIIAGLAAIIGTASSFATNSEYSSKKPTTLQPKVAGVSAIKYPKTDEAGNNSKVDADTGDASLFEDQTAPPAPSPAPTPPTTPPAQVQNTINGYSFECRLNDDGATYSAYKIAHWSNGADQDLGIDSSTTCDSEGNPSQ